MTDVMPKRQAVDLDELADGEPAGAGVLDAVDEQLIAWLAGRARERGLQLTGEGRVARPAHEAFGGVRAGGRDHRSPRLLQVRRGRPRRQLPQWAPLERRC